MSFTWFKEKCFHSVALQEQVHEENISKNCNFSIVMFMVKCNEWIYVFCENEWSEELLLAAFYQQQSEKLKESF